MESRGDKKKTEVEGEEEYTLPRPPSFTESQFATIIRRQKRRKISLPSCRRLEEDHREEDLPETWALPSIASPSAARRRHELQGRRESSPDAQSNAISEEQTRLPKLTRSKSSDRNDWTSWHFAGWGNMTMMEISQQDLQEAQKVTDQGPKPVLGWARAASIAGNALTGSVFYSIPAVLSGCYIFTPLALLLAVLLLWPFRMIMCHLASILQCGDASSYTYLLNTVSKSYIALMAAAIILLDAIATGSVSAATASKYIYNQVDTGILSSSTSTFLQGAGIIIVLLAGMCLITLLGLKDSANISLLMISIHLLTMFALIIAGMVQWAKGGNAILIENWQETMKILSHGKGIARSIFDGTCIAFVGLTGFEMTPTYVQSVKKGQFKVALQSLHLATLVTEVPLALLVVVLIPMQSSLNSTNVLAVLAQVCTSSNINSTSTWLKYLVVTDAVIVLMGGVLTGIQATCGLCQSLAYDGILASIFLSKMVKTKAFYASIALFFILCLIFCAVFQFDMATMSSVFSMTFLFVMLSFPISLMLIKWTRPRLLNPESTGPGLACIQFAIAVAITALVGNIALQPINLLKTALLALGIFFALWSLKSRVEIARFTMWMMHERWFKLKSSFQLKGASKIKGIVIKWMKMQRSKPIIFFTNTDQISHLVKAIRYIEEVSFKKNSSCLID